MPYLTGQTIYEQVVSVDQNNSPVSAATFDTVLYRNGSAYALTVNTSLYDAARGIFAVNFVPDDTGRYQLYMNNTTTNMIYISDVYDVTSAGTIANIYVGI